MQSYKTTIIENKTGKVRHIAVNDAVKEALCLFLEHRPKSYNEYLFTSESNNKSHYGEGEPLSRQAVGHMISTAAKELGIVGRSFATHSLRKTFGYHQYVNASKNGQSMRALQAVQKLFGHSSEKITLSYIGITDEELEGLYLSLNLALQ